MNDPNVIAIIVGTVVVLLMGGAGLVFVRTGTAAEQRLDGLHGERAKAKVDPSAGMLLRPPAIDKSASSLLTKLVPDVEKLNTLYEQADVSMPFPKFMGVVGCLAIAGMAVLVAFGPHPLLAPVGGAVMGGLPFLWLVRRRNNRVKKFMYAMPEAVELISRALRAGHGLASGLRLVAEEMRGPIADEFGRVFEEQNLGIPIEMSLRGLAERIPTMDVRFFVVAVIIQRSTGGDLAEVLDKIGKLIRQRYELFGHVRSLTAEGRLSGIVLLALPPGLLGFLSFTNFQYIATLFNTPVGNKMLVVTVVLQLIGAWSIQKIVSIKV